MWSSLFATCVTGTNHLPRQQPMLVERNFRVQGPEGLQGLLVRVSAVPVLWNKQISRNLRVYKPSMSIEQ